MLFLLQITPSFAAITTPPFIASLELVGIQTVWSLNMMHATTICILVSYFSAYRLRKVTFGAHQAAHTLRFQNNPLSARYSVLLVLCPCLHSLGAER